VNTEASGRELAEREEHRTEVTEATEGGFGLGGSAFGERLDFWAASGDSIVRRSQNLPLPNSVTPPTPRLPHEGSFTGIKRDRIGSLFL
jgi:hypothetical protein